MTREQTITNIYKSHIIEKIANKNISKLRQYKDDFIQFMYELICMLPEEKLCCMSTHNEIDYYLIYVCRAQIYNEKSDFWRAHKERIDISYSLDDPNYTEKNTDEDYD